MATLGQLVVSLSAETSRLEAGLTKARKQSESTFAGIASAAKKAFAPAAIIGAGGLFAQQIKANAEFADSMAKSAERAGVTAEAMSKLSYAAQLSDVSTTALSKGLREMGNAAANGGSKLTDLGVSLTDSTGKAKTSDALFADVAERINAISDPAKRAAEAVKIFGDRAGPELLPLLSSGAEGIKKAADEAKRFGLVVTDEAAAAAIQFNDNMTRLAASARGMSVSLTGPAISALANITEAFIEARAENLNFIQSLDRGLQNAGKASGLAEAERQVIAAREELEKLTKVAEADPFNTRAIYESEMAYGKLMDKVRDLGDLQRKEADKTAKVIADKEAADIAEREKRRQEAVKRDIERQRRAFQSFQEGLTRQAEAYQNLTQVETTLREIQSGRLGVLTQAQQDLLVSRAQELDQLKQITELEQQRNALTSEGISVTMGLRTAFEKAADEEARLQELFDEGAISADTLARGVAKIRTEFAASSAPIQQFAEDGAKSMAALEGAVRGWGDNFTNTMTNIVMTGKGSFADLANSIIRDLARIAVQKMITDKIVGAFTGGFGSIFGGGRALGGSVKAGTSYLVGEKGPEVFTPTTGGNITPNSSVGGGNNINVYVTNSGTRTEGGDGAGKALGQLIATSVNNALINAKRPGGLLA
jgi:hypothetical protein